MELKQIGTIENTGEFACVRLQAAYAPALEALDGFSHVCLLWWGHLCDSEASRGITTIQSPYKKGPETLGVFATRSPERPNPIALSICAVKEIDVKNGLLWLWYTDAADGTPLLDIKPYTPSLDRVREWAVPDWCAHWPQWSEDSEAFDWESEFNF